MWVMCSQCNGRGIFELVDEFGDEFERICWYCDGSGEDEVEDDE